MPFFGVCIDVRPHNMSAMSVVTAVAIGAVAATVASARITKTDQYPAETLWFYAAVSSLISLLQIVSVFWFIALGGSLHDFLLGNLESSRAQFNIHLAYAVLASAPVLWVGYLFNRFRSNRDAT